MRTHRLVILLAAILLAASPVVASDEIDAKTWRATLTQVLPSKADLVWTQVPWRTSLWDAVIEANREEKPILLWAMNGHALACT